MLYIIQLFFFFFFMHRISRYLAKLFIRSRKPWVAGRANMKRLTTYFFKWQADIFICIISQKYSPDSLVTLKRLSPFLQTECGTLLRARFREIRKLKTIWNQKGYLRTCKIMHWNIKYKTFPVWIHFYIVDFLQS